MGGDRAHGGIVSLVQGSGFRVQGSGSTARLQSAEAYRTATVATSPLSNTVTPRSIVVSTWPRSRQPSYGVTGCRWCRDFASTVHSHPDRRRRGPRLVRRQSPLLPAGPASLAGLAASQSASALDRNTARGGAGPHDRQPELQRRDASPRAHEVAIVEVLQRRRRRRVVGGDQIDVAVDQRRPQALAIGSRADRRRALERRRAVGDLFGGKRQVVRARFHAQRRRRPRGPHGSRAAPRPTRGGRCGRARRTRWRAARASRWRPARSRLDGCRARCGSAAGPGVPRPPTGPRREATPATPRARAAAGRAPPGSGGPSRRSASPTCPNSSTPDGHRKHLKPRTPAARQRRQVGGVARHDAAPESHVDMTSTARRGAFLLEAGNRRGRRDAVERHVHERGDAAGRGRARRVREALPVGTPGIVDVDVRIDERRAARRAAPTSSSGTPAGRSLTAPIETMRPSRMMDRRRADAIRQDHALAANDQGHAPSCGEPISE